ncbi:MAG: DUF4430 domain-containing protein [Nitrososphaerota archaeon]|nr:DUF4430 domain-containing protein [Aigarchaeota archaeon]MDW8077027.1 DUF4430 domain-containing protein [Nitrososphaerota archaeon]
MVRKEFQAIIIAFVVLSLALVYVGYQVYDLQIQFTEQVKKTGVLVETLVTRIDELEGLILKVEVTIDSGNATKTEVIWLTKGATALEALRRIAVVETRYFAGLGEFIESVDGLRNNPEIGKYWMWYIWNEEKARWEYATVGAGSYKLRDEDKIMFRYEVPTW